MPGHIGEAVFIEKNTFIDGVREEISDENDQWETHSCPGSIESEDLKKYLYVSMLF